MKLNPFDISSVDGALKVFQKVLEALQRIKEKQLALQESLQEKSRVLDEKIENSKKEIDKAEEVIQNINKLIGN